MSKFAATFSGKFGDVIWSLPTARQISRMVGEPIDFYTMPYYESLKELIGKQSYINKAGVISGWLREHSNHGDQPAVPQIWPEEKNYERVFHLTYRGHPGISAPSMPLIDFIAYQQGIKLAVEEGGMIKPIVPFIEVEHIEDRNLPGTLSPFCGGGKTVVMSFNEQYDQMKKEFREAFRNYLGEQTIIVSLETLSWVEAAWAASKAIAYVGDRSANWVIANGVAQNCIITYEPHQARHASGGLGKVFGNPYWKEIPLPFNMPPAVCADAAASMVRKAANGKVL